MIRDELFVRFVLTFLISFSVVSLIIEIAERLLK
jgi:hypothetical protein